MAAMVASHHPGMWQRRSSQVMQMSPMGIPTMVPATPTAPSARPYQQTNHIDLPMNMFPTTSAPSMVQFPASSYGFDLSSMNQYQLQQNYDINYPGQAQPTPAYSAAPTEMPTAISHVGVAHEPLPIAHRSPSVKAEAQSPLQANQMYSDNSSDELRSYHTDSSLAGVSFSTDVDCLMKAIQAQEKTPTQPAPSKVRPQTTTARPARQQTQSSQIRSNPTTEGRSKPRKRYQCSIPRCNKSFYQKTHLEIHTRAHTGVKPFVCKEPSCGQRFSQLGNLKTHERRHTGERPYICEQCGKTFAQRGNVRAHKIVHQQIKPFTCKLDDCGKQFTQLGNLKSHQNKFHAQTLRYLTSKFANLREGDPVTPTDKVLWEYFASLYKNSNKGIKGRGKDRRISTTTNTVSMNANAIPSSACSVTSSAPSFTLGAPQMALHHDHHDRSRSSSYYSADEAPVVMAEAPHHHGGFEEHAGWSNSVFPERKMF